MLTVKFIHIAAVIITGCLFFIRGIGHFCGAGFMRWRWLRVTPHINDSVLLLSAMVLVFNINPFPSTIDWLTAKLLALIIYILLGMVALKWAKTRGMQIGAWFAALFVYAYIVSVALLRQPQGFLLL